MRASSFSNAKVIDLLNRYCVPVHASNQDYGDRGDVPAEEKAAKNRIYRHALEAGLKAGTVCAYLVTPEGRPIATAPLNEDVAADPEKLATLLERGIKQLEVVPGETLSPAKPRSGPGADADALVLHIVARYLERRGQDFIPHEM